jgi:ribosomal-protein-alanine N-acetyltransferase
MNVLFSTERLLFREFTVEDAQLILTLNSNPAVTKYLHELPTNTVADAAAIIEERILPQYRLYGYGRWAVIRKEDDAFLGWCGLKYRPERDETDLGYRFMEYYWGKGYATEAAKACMEKGFQKYQLSVITARAHIENLASIRVIEHCGMIYLRDEIVDNCPVKTYFRENPMLSAIGQ